MIIEHNQNNIKTQFKNLSPSIIAVLCKIHKGKQTSLYKLYLTICIHCKTIVKIHTKMLVQAAVYKSANKVNDEKLTLTYHFRILCVQILKASPQKTL